jgi:hypothetical protein
MGNLATDTEETSTVSAAPAGNMGGYMPKYLRDTLAAETTASSPVKAQQSFTNPMDTRSEYESTPSVTGTTVSMCSDLSNSKNPYQDSAAVIKVLQNKSSTTSNRNPSAAARRVPLSRGNKFPKAVSSTLPSNTSRSDQGIARSQNPYSRRTEAFTPNQSAISC